MIADFLKLGYETLLKALLQKAVEKGFSSLGFGKLLPHGKISFEDHLAKTFDRCSKTKTLVNPDTSLDLMSMYVGAHFKTNIDGTKEKVIDDFDMISEIFSNRRIVISGTAGRGKTFFTKYFWLASFTGSSGKIPIFLELRMINELSSASPTALMDLIFHNVVKNNTDQDVRSAFDSSVKQGRYIFILDGFDELREDRRDLIEREILRIATESNENVILVTGRPDERFHSWQAFTNYHIQPLDKSQVLTLVDRISFDPGVKKKFKERVKKDLFEKHQSFLSTPLLTTMMLLTFSNFADVPDKVHVFYEQAFDTLFARHDSLKESFKRQFYSDLTIDVFKNEFSIFCLLSYEKQSVSFNESQALELLKHTKALTGAKYDEKCVLKDLLESICMLQREGMNLVFAHRSFQEFFAARALSRLQEERVKKLLPRFVVRVQDNMMNMLYDMNREVVEDCYLIPQYQKHKLTIDLLAQKHTAQDLCEIEGCASQIRRLMWKPQNKSETVFHYSMEFTGTEVFDFLMIAQKIMHLEFKSKERFFDDLQQKSQAADTNAERSGLFGRLELLISSQNSSSRTNFRELVVFDGQRKVRDDLFLAIEDWYAEGAHSAYNIRIAQLVGEACEKTIRESARRYQSIDDIFGL